MFVLFFSFIVIFWGGGVLILWTCRSIYTWVLLKDGDLAPHIRIKVGSLSSTPVLIPWPSAPHWTASLPSKPGKAPSPVRIQVRFQPHLSSVLHYKTIWLQHGNSSNSNGLKQKNRSKPVLFFLCYPHRNVVDQTAKYFNQKVLNSNYTPKLT